MSALPTTVAHAVALLTRPLIDVYTANTLAQHQLVLEANLTALYAPAWEPSAPGVAASPSRRDRRFRLAPTPDALQMPRTRSLEVPLLDLEQFRFSFFSGHSFPTEQQRPTQSRRQRVRQLRVYVDASKDKVTLFDGGKTTVVSVEDRQFRMLGQQACHPVSLPHLWARLLASAARLRPRRRHASYLSSLSAARDQAHRRPSVVQPPPLPLDPTRPTRIASRPSTSALSTICLRIPVETIVPA
ncbi:hypothetical protein R3P38DRAFT_3201362 [Favolaschia claudopus]|uniref:Uncharacterized protein n=1 Tax=Favolaschia claudopus TaxID=2862362 RepID=A0AAW0AWZ4_9AGAR